MADNAVFSSGGNGGVIEKYDWNNNLIWSFIISGFSECQHHDIMPLPNGNILAIVWEMHDSVDAVANGKNPALVNQQFWGEKIVEIQPVGTNQANIVWEWKLWDHLVQEFDPSKLNYAMVVDHPELVNINYTTGSPVNPDWIHLNSIDYNAELDQILLSSHNLSEIWVIDHSTSTAEAATHTGGNSGKGGDILYRWGNPAAYQRGTSGDRKFYSQHHASWIPQGYPSAGNILVFNNGLNRPGGNYTSIDMIETPVDIQGQYPIGATTAYLPDTLFWTYTDPIPTDFYANKIGGAYELSDGSFIITNGPKGTFFEIDANKETVWKYINPVNAGIMSQGATPVNNSVFRCNFYESSYTAFASQTLVPQGEIELNPISPSICDSILSSIDQTGIVDMRIYPNPATTELHFPISAGTLDIEVFDIYGTSILHDNNANNVLRLDGLESGIYLLKIYSRSNTITQRIVIVK